MHDNHNFFNFFIGVFVGGLCVIIFAVNFSGTITYKAIAAKQDCEKSLPRDQHCIITATPQEERNTYEYR